jgi:hypothetical protein
MSVALTCVLVFCTPFILPAEGQEVRVEQEVQHLLEFIEGSGCTFIRNGSAHDSSTARKHLSRKYQHIRTRVGSGEDFITYAASRSSITGNAYQVKCGSETITSRDWLTRELDRYRLERDSALD